MAFDYTGGFDTLFDPQCGFFRAGISCSGHHSGGGSHIFGKAFQRLVELT